VDISCHQCKRWWLPLFLPQQGRNAPSPSGVHAAELRNNPSMGDFGLCRYVVVAGILAFKM